MRPAYWSVICRPEVPGRSCTRKDDFEGSCACAAATHSNRTATNSFIMSQRFNSTGLSVLAGQGTVSSSAGCSTKSVVLCVQDAVATLSPLCSQKIRVALKCKDDCLERDWMAQGAVAVPVWGHAAFCSTTRARPIAGQEELRGKPHRCKSSTDHAQLHLGGDLARTVVDDSQMHFSGWSLGCIGGCESYARGYSCSCTPRE